jgi:hypothetical protein
MRRPSQLHLHGGGLQGGAPLHNTAEDMHEQQPVAAPTSVAVPQRLPREGANGTDGPLHGDPVHPQAQVRAREDLSKFYQRVDTDPAPSHVERGDTSAEMKVYITKTVNFGDKIAIAREQASLSEEIFRETAWFLKNRTYVDDATTGADSLEQLQGFSKEMEAVAKQGGFEFKETLMSGDKENADGEPHKVLGLIWETEADRQRVDLKLNLGAKKAGLHLMENIMLDDEPEKALPEVITKRELWRVAQGQYDPLGLLCTSTFRFKILMRSLVEETSHKVVGWDKLVSTGTNEEFRKVVSHLAELRAITFLRAVKPKEEVVGKPMLLVQRKYASFFHRLSILVRATDHGCINDCNHPKEM